ncbi:MAG: hypothetical protein ACYS8L_10435, partial [Planctomycetota bacterium]
MRQTRNLPLFASMALTFCCVQLLGCAATAEPTAAEEAGAAAEEQAAAAAGPVAAPLETLRHAEQAYAEEDYERARDLFSAVLEAPAELSEEQAAGAREALGRAESILHQRRLAQEQAEAEAPAGPAEAAEAAEAAEPAEAAEAAESAEAAEPAEAVE